MGCTFDELISFLTPVINTLTAGKYDTSTENEKQARVLDALIALNDWGHIFLNSRTDKSFITIKGLIAVKNKDFCN